MATLVAHEARGHTTMVALATTRFERLGCPFQTEHVSRANTIMPGGNGATLFPPKFGVSEIEGLLLWHQNKKWIT